MIKFEKGYGKNLLPKAKTLYDRTAGTLTNITGLVNQHELSVIELKTLDNLVNNSLGIWNSATPANPSQVDAGGSAIFRVQKLLQFNTYTSANRDDKGQLPKSEIKVKIDIKDSQVCKYELETLDLPGLGFGTREQFVAFIAAGMQKSMTALMDAHYIDVFVQDIKAKITAWKAANTGKTFADYVKTTDQVVYNEHWGDLGAAATDALTLDFALKQAYRSIARAKVLIALKLDRYNLGANKEDFATFLHEIITVDLLIAMPKGGNDATTVGRELTGPEGSTRVAGLGLVKPHLYFGKNIPKNTSFSVDTDFNFASIWGLTAHQEAAFVAIQGLVSTGVIDPNSGNQKYVMKFNLFKGMVRDELYVLYVSADPTV